MKEIVLDTETTGLDPFKQHRLVEIGCVELENRVPTGRVYHQYINPERDMPEAAFNVHGLSIDFLKDFPTFKEIADDFIEFIQDMPLVIHNARFDMKFLNAELSWLSKPEIPFSQAVDTLLIARKKFPGSPANLDALCKRFNIDNSNREKHGALLDSELLAEVYLELTGGRQTAFNLEVVQTEPERLNTKAEKKLAFPLRDYPLKPQEQEMHEKMLEKIGNSLWR